MGTLNREEGGKRIEELFEETVTENFPQIKTRHQTTEAGSSANTNQEKILKNHTHKTKTIPTYVTFKL